MGGNSTYACEYNIYIGYAGISLCLVVICSSVLTIVTICRTRKLHTNQYIFILSLAVADILMSLSIFAISSFHLTSLNYIVDESTVLKNLIYGMLFSCVVLGMLHMSIIAVDRYIRIAHPFYYIRNMTKQRTIKILTFTYLLWLINSCIPAIVHQDIKFNYCFDIYQMTEYYYSNKSILAINMIVACVCYSKIAWIAIRHKRTAMSRRQQTEEIGSEIINRNNRMMVMKSVQFFVVMFGVFFILTLPPFVINNLAASDNVSGVTVTLAAHCFPLHSVLNFVICCSMNQAFFKALKKTFADLKTFCFTCYE